MLLRATVQEKRIQRERAMLRTERRAPGGRRVSGRFDVGHSFPHALSLMKNLPKKQREREQTRERSILIAGPKFLLLAFLRL